MTDPDDHERENEQAADDYPVGPSGPGLVDYQPAVYPIARDGAAGEKPSGQDRFQFSLAELLLLMAAASLVLGVLGCFPPKYGATLAGLGVLLSMIVLAVIKPSRAIVHVGWWVMLFVYLLTCIVAIVLG